MKDFLFIYFSQVLHVEYLFRSIENSGYSCDFVTQETIDSFIPKTKYRVVICYMHEQPWVNATNRILAHSNLSESFIVQHDDTDFDNVMQYYSREPNMVFQRELTTNSVSPYSVPCIPMHFPFPGIYNPANNKKDIDISFIGARTNPRRERFIDTITYLSKTSLSHLNWFIKFDNNRNHDEFCDIANRSKISLHYFGNAQDSIRIWELASSKTCLFMPENNLLSITDNYMPIKNVVLYKQDFSDLEEKLHFYMTENRYVDKAQQLFDEYNQNHIPEKCFEHYYKYLLHYAPIRKEPCKPLNDYSLFKLFFSRPF